MLSGLARREALRRAHRALDALDVGEERYRPSRGYSTGMRQRTKLAMSLVHDPQFLILDEPTVGLDPPGRRQLLELIRDLRDEGRRILVSTHIMQDADFLCDDLLLIEAGTIAYSGPVHELVHARERSLVAEGSGLGADFAAALENAGYRVRREGDEALAFEPSDEDLGIFWKLAADRDVEVRYLGSDALTLEDAVVSVMEGKVRPGGNAR